MTNSQDYYAVFGIAPKLNLDAAELQRRFYELSRQLHPDRFARRDAAERQQALDASAVLNDAYRTLRDPAARAEYLLSRHGFDIGEQRSSNVPPELLEEVFELNMALDQLREGDQSARPALEQARSAFEASLGQIDSELAGLFVAWDEQSAPAVLAQIRGALNRRRYIQNLVRDAKKALDGGAIPANV